MNSMKYFRISVRNGLALVLFCLTTSAFSQISVSPTSLYIHSDTKIGTLYISNGSEQPQEVSISVLFGYPGSDEAGNMTMVYEDSTAQGKYGLNDWVRVFPRTFTLAAKQQQTVRVQVRAPRGIDEGTYWTRVKITSNAQTPDVEQAVTDQISTRVTFKFEQVIAAFYLNGKTETGLSIDRITAEQTEKNLSLLASVVRTGNSPFIGMIKTELLDDQGNSVLTREMTTAVYFDALRRVDLDVTDITPGKYTAKVTFETTRRDVDPADLVKCQPVSQTIPVEVK